MISCQLHNTIMKRYVFADLELCMCLWTLTLEVSFVFWHCLVIWCHGTSLLCCDWECFSQMLTVYDRIHNVDYASTNRIYVLLL